MKNECHGYFAGIGSRDTPDKYLEILEEGSRYLVKAYRLRLRSGHAIKADRACEIGAGGFADIYLPWKTYGIKPYKEDPGMKVIGDTIIPEREDQIAEFMCDLVGRKPFDEMNNGVQLLMSRNVNQIIGHFRPFRELSRIVLCYSWKMGGTSYATALAKHYEIPVINVLDKDLDTVIAEIDKILPLPQRKLSQKSLLEGIIVE